VLQVKERLAVVEGAAPNQQRLVFAGKVMDDGKTLATFDVNNRSTLHMALKL
jgi:ubiquitin C